MESFASQARAFAYALAVHVVLILLVWFGVDWLLPPRDAAAAGEPVQATLRVSDADLKRAKAAIAKVEKKVEEAAPKPQPVPEPAPQVSPTPPQPKPQEQLDRPDTVDQQAISRLAVEQPPELFDRTFHHVTAPNRYGLPSFYALHAWVWQANPAGMFENMNTMVTCADAPAVG